MSVSDATIALTEELAARDDMIVCEGVNKWFGDFQALDQITATIKEREVVVVLGPSGSGKSTWIRCINRLEAHQEGRIVVDGVELTNDVRNIEKIRSEVGMVFQQFNLFPHLTVLDNITLAPLWVRKKPPGRGRGTGPLPAGAGRHTRAGPQVPGPALRRPAAAGGHRPGPGHGAPDHALRRAHLRARPRDDL